MAQLNAKNRPLSWEPTSEKWANKYNTVVGNGICTPELWFEKKNWAGLGNWINSLLHIPQWGYSWEFLVGVGHARFYESWPYFRPKNCHFPHPFSDLASKIHTRFRSQNATIHVYINRNYVILSEIIKPTKHIHKLRRLPCNPEKIPDQNGPNLYPFSDQKEAKTIPFGAAHTHMDNIREYPSVIFLRF